MLEIKKINQATGEHFNLSGHSISDMKLSIIVKVKSNDPPYRKERERQHSTAWQYWSGQPYDGYWL